MFVEYSKKITFQSISNLAKMLNAATEIDHE